MGNTDSKVDFRVAVVQLTSRSQVRFEFNKFSINISLYFIAN
jgi:hypothetical protein